MRKIWIQKTLFGGSCFSRAYREFLCWWVRPYDAHSHSLWLTDHVTWTILWALLYGPYNMVVHGLPIWRNILVRTVLFTGDQERLKPLHMHQKIYHVRNIRFISDPKSYGPWYGYRISNLFNSTLLLLSCVLKIHPTKKYKKSKRTSKVAPTPV